MKAGAVGVPAERWQALRRSANEYEGALGTKAMGKKHPVPPRVCEICGQVFANNVDLTKHNKTHPENLQPRRKKQLAHIFATEPIRHRMPGSGWTGRRQK